MERPRSLISAVCPKTGRPCWYCSMATLVRTSRVGVIATGLMERRIFRTELGAWCENDGQHFVRDLPECPMPAALAVELKPLEDDPLLWMQLRRCRE